MFHELELEGLEDIVVEASVQNVSQVIRKTKLSKIYGPLSVLNDTNVDTVKGQEYVGKHGSIVIEP